MPHWYDVVPASLTLGVRIGRIRASSKRHGPVAQLVEQRIENPRVGSSILPWATIFLFSRG